jgi:hypothetical protein
MKADHLWSDCLQKVLRAPFELSQNSTLFLLYIISYYSFSLVLRKRVSSNNKRREKNREYRENGNKG